jgi:hypothetical protein
VEKYKHAHFIFLVPKENVAVQSLSASVIEGVSRSRNALLNGDTKTYDWDSGYTCHQLGSGCIVVQLGQPYMIDSMRWNFYILNAINARWMKFVAQNAVMGLRPSSLQLLRGGFGQQYRLGYGRWQNQGGMPLLATAALQKAACGLHQDCRHSQHGKWGTQKNKLWKSQSLSCNSNSDQNFIFKVFHVVHFECPAQLDQEVKKEETADADEGPSGVAGPAPKDGSGDESDVEDSREAEVFHSTEQ